MAVRLPDGASIERTDRVVGQVEDILRSNPGVEAVTSYGGLDRLTNTINSNVATVIALLEPWDERDALHLDQQAILRAMQPKFAQVQSAIVFGFGLPPILGLGASGGFELMLQDRTDGDLTPPFGRDTGLRASRTAASGNRVDQHGVAYGRPHSSASTSIPTKRKRSGCPLPMSIRRCRHFSAGCT